MARCVRIWTSAENDAVFQEGIIALAGNDRQDTLSGLLEVMLIAAYEPQTGAVATRHHALIRQRAITLSGTLELQTRTGEQVILHPGDVLLVQDSPGSCQEWDLVDDGPKRQAYLIASPEQPVAPPLRVNIQQRES